MGRSSSEFICYYFLPPFGVQALQCFDALKTAWFSRKQEIEARGKAMGGAGMFGGGGYGYGGAYGGQAQEIARLEQASPLPLLHNP